MDPVFSIELEFTTQDICFYCGKGVLGLFAAPNSLSLSSAINIKVHVPLISNLINALGAALLSGVFPQVIEIAAGACRISAPSPEEPESPLGIEPR